MPLNYTVQAEVVDIRSDSPKKEDIFLVDTNAWYWYTYTNASISSRPYQITDYPSYLAKAISANSLLLYCGLSLAELAHNIEQVERKIFSSTLTALIIPSQLPDREGKSGRGSPSGLESGNFDCGMY
jgi:hypothetical protein